MRRLILILGDQLSSSLSALADLDPQADIVLMAEVAEEAQYVPHHKQKIALLLSAMRHFADDLRARGVTVDYVRLDDPANTGDFAGEVARAAQRHSATRIVSVAGGEWRVVESQRQWAERSGLPLTILDDDRFLCTIEQFAGWAKGRKRMIMEDFYRIMRRQTGLLMDGDQPIGGQWNYDQENRKSVPKGHRFTPPLRFAPDAITTEVMALVAGRFGNHFGSIDGFSWAVTREQALAALHDFITHRLAVLIHARDQFRLGIENIRHT